jgi:L-fuconolactonase
MTLDAHVHLWSLARGDYEWLTPDLAPLYRDFGPNELAPLLAAAGVSGAIAVQAAPTEAETRFLLDLADRTPALLGVVGWADFAAPDAEAAIGALAVHAKLLGLRPMLQDLADDDFILRPDADRALGALASRGLVFEALVRPRHLNRLLTVRERHPDLAIVIDHAAKPDIAGGAWSPWAEDLRRLAADGKTVCKLSGLITEAGANWTVERLRPYADLVIDAFGPDRVMWGSDWPVLRLAGSYEAWRRATDRLLEDLVPADRARVLGETARRVYALQP